MPESIQSNPDSVSTAVEENALALKYACHKLRCDPKFVRKATSKYPLAWFFAEGDALDYIYRQTYGVPSPKFLEAFQCRPDCK